MNKRKNAKRVVIILLMTIIVEIGLIVMMNRVTYDSLETNLKNTIIASDRQKADVLMKQVSVFFSTMEGFVTSISQMSNDLEKDKTKLVILLSDLSNELEASGMGIVKENGKGLVGVSVDFDKYSGMKKALNGENSVTVVKNGPGGERNCLLFSVPLVDSVSGDKYVFYATIVKEYIYKVFRSNTEYKDQYIMLFNKNRDVMFPMTDLQKQNQFMNIMENPQKYGVKKELEDYVQKVMKKKGDMGKFNFKGIGSYYIDVVYIEGTDMFLVSFIGDKETTAYIRYAAKVARIIFSIMIAMFGLAILLILVLQYRNQSKVYKLAYMDKLTGIYNWECLQIRIRDYIKDGKKIALVLFDVKGLKYINDIYGFSNGDKLLVEIAEFLKVNRPIDTKTYGYARLDDDAFIIVVEGEIDKHFIKMIKAFMNSLQSKVSTVFDVDFAVGIAPIASKEDGNYYGVIDNAYSAMDSMRKQAGITIGVYDQELREELVKSKKLEGDLPVAIKNRELVVYLQPKYDAETEKIVGAEALVRWQHNELGFINPGQFIPIFESNGMISKIDRYVLEEVCVKMKEWKEKGLNTYPISINLSRAEVNDKNLVNVVTSVREKYGVNAELIEIEITESSVANNEEQLFLLMNELRDSGFRLSMDDFGTGYSSLSQLMKMPIDYLKLDKSFIDNCTTDDEENKTDKFIANVIRIAKDINCKVVAEGVETKEQRDTLLKAGCDIIQGYYYAKPMPINEYEELLKKDA